MPVTIPDEDWKVIFDYFHASFSATDNNSVHEVLDLQDDAWERVQRIAEKNGLSRDH